MPASEFWSIIPDLAVFLGQSASSHCHFLATALECDQRFEKGNATAQGATALTYRLDSGAGVSVIHRDTARSPGLEFGPRVTVQGVHSTLAGHWPLPLSATCGGVLSRYGVVTMDGKAGRLVLNGNYDEGFRLPSRNSTTNK